jgi:putative transferase (TIGR04331 family)
MLNQPIRDNNLLIRLYHSDYGYNEKARWERALSKVNFSKDNSKIYQLVSDSRLVVYTYNVSTGYLEFINANIPTIIFWDMKSSPVSDDAIEIFEDLKNVGIFHNDPESAANHINLIWDNIDDWWNSENVRNARLNLCLKFANVHPNIENNIENILRENL